MRKAIVIKTPKEAKMQSTTVTETCTVTVSFLGTPSYGIPAVGAEKEKERCKIVFGGITVCSIWLGPGLQRSVPV